MSFLSGLWSTVQSGVRDGVQKLAAGVSEVNAAVDKRVDTFSAQVDAEDARVKAAAAARQQREARKKEAFPPYKVLDETKSILEGELQQRLLRLSQDERTFVVAAPADDAFAFDLELALPFAVLALQWDAKLQAAHHKLVPKRVTEPKFFRNYFFRVQSAREQIGVEPLPLHAGALPPTVAAAPTAAAAAAPALPVAVPVAVAAAAGTGAGVGATAASAAPKQHAAVATASNAADAPTAAVSVASVADVKAPAKSSDRAAAPMTAFVVEAPAPAKPAAVAAAAATSSSALSSSTSPNARPTQAPAAPAAAAAAASEAAAPASGSASPPAAAAAPAPTPSAAVESPTLNALMAEAAGLDDFASDDFVVVAGAKAAGAGAGAGVAVDAELADLEKMLADVTASTATTGAGAAAGNAKTGAAAAPVDDFELP